MAPRTLGPNLFVFTHSPNTTCDGVTGTGDIKFVSGELVAVRLLLSLSLLLFCAAGAELAHVDGRPLSKQNANPKCLEWKEGACMVCGIDSTINISVKNKTKTRVLLCRDMKPGPVRVEMVMHAEPTIPGLWEVEFGLGYQTSARSECPHQFIASNHPPLKTAYEIGPLSIESEIPPDGVIQTLACVGLSSARVGGKGVDTEASLRVFKLQVVRQ
jgi:hypothetical protein